MRAAGYGPGYPIGVDPNPRREAHLEALLCGAPLAVGLGLMPVHHGWQRQRHVHHLKRQPQLVQVRPWGVETAATLRRGSMASCGLRMHNEQGEGGAA